MPSMTWVISTQWLKVKHLPINECEQQTDRDRRHCSYVYFGVSDPFCLRLMEILRILWPQTNCFTHYWRWCYPSINCRACQQLMTCKKRRGERRERYAQRPWASGKSESLQIGFGPLWKMSNFNFVPVLDVLKMKEKALTASRSKKDAKREGERVERNHFCSLFLDSISIRVV